MGRRGIALGLAAVLFLMVPLQENNRVWGQEQSAGVETVITDEVEVSNQIEELEQAVYEEDGAWRLLVWTKEEAAINLAYANSVIKGYADLYILNYEEKESWQRAFDELSLDERIQWVEKDVELQVEDAEQICTPEEMEASNVEMPEQEAEESAQEQVGDAMDEQPDTEGIRVAVIDTGMDANIDEKKHHILAGRNFSGQGELEDVTDENGHGTQVSTLILENAVEEIEVLPVKVADQSGHATILGTYMGMQYALEQQADLINLSMGTGEIRQSYLLKDVIRKAQQRGCIVVTSAGNQGKDVADCVPANMEEVVAVGSVNDKDEISDFSNYGATIDCCALGENILVSGTGAIEERVNGTSYAAAIATATFASACVSGEIAGTESVMDYVKTHARHGERSGWDPYYGYGIIGGKITGDLLPEQEAEAEQTEEQQTEEEQAEAGQTAAEQTEDQERGDDAEDEDVSDLEEEIERENQSLKEEVQSPDQGEQSQILEELCGQDAMQLELDYKKIIDSLASCSISDNLYAVEQLVGQQKKAMEEMQLLLKKGSMPVSFFEEGGDGNTGLAKNVYQRSGKDEVDDKAELIQGRIDGYVRGESGSENAEELCRELDQFYEECVKNCGIGMQVESVKWKEVAPRITPVMQKEEQLLTEGLEVEQEVGAKELLYERYGTELYGQLMSLTMEDRRGFVQDMSQAEREELAECLGSYYQKLMTSIMDGEIGSKEGVKNVYIADEATLRMYVGGAVAESEMVTEGLNDVAITSNLVLTSHIATPGTYVVSGNVKISSAKIDGSDEGYAIILGDEFKDTPESMFYITRGNTLTLDEYIVLDGKKIEHNGALLFSDSGTLNIKGHAFLKNNKTCAGINSFMGAVIMMNANFVEFPVLNISENCTLKNNTSNVGGTFNGVICGTGIITMSGGSITENQNYHGAITMNNGSLTLKGGSKIKISNNQSDGIFMINHATLNTGKSVNMEISNNAEQGIDIQESNCTATIANAGLRIHGNQKYGIQNMGNVQIKAELLVGVKKYEKKSGKVSFQKSVNKSGGIKNLSGGVVNIEGAAKIYGGGVAAFENAGEATIKQGLFWGNGDKSILINDTQKDEKTDLIISGGTILGKAKNGILIQSGDVTLQGGELTGSYTIGTASWSSSSKTHNLQNGIYVNGEGHFKIEGGTIQYGKTGIFNLGVTAMSHGNILNHSTQGVYQNGTFSMSGNAVVDSGNVVTLPDGKYITVAGALTTEGCVAVVQPLDNKAKVQTTAGRVVVRTSYHNGKGSDALFYGKSGKRFTVSNGTLLRPGDYMSDKEVKAEKKNGKILDTDITLSKKYAVSYHGNLEGATVTVPKALVKYWCESLTVPVTTPKITSAEKSRYTFKCWNTKADESGTTEKKKFNYEKNAKLSLYAIWNPHMSILKVNPGIGTVQVEEEVIEKSKNFQKKAGVVLQIGKPQIANYQVTFDKNHKAATLTKKSQKTNKAFKQWKKTYGSKQKAFKGSLSDLSKEMTCTYQYADENGITDIITANYSGSYVVTTPTEKQCKRDGYTLLGWDEETNADFAVYANGEKITLNRDMKLYAVWEPKVYRILLDNQGADLETGKEDIFERYQDAYYGEEGCYNKYRVNIFRIVTPKKTDYEFVGYYTQKNAVTTKPENAKGTKVIDANGNVVAKADLFTSDSTIYAFWQTYYTVTYHANSDNHRATVPETQKKSSSYDLKLTLEPAEVTDVLYDKLYRFEGWSTSPDGSTGIITDDVYKTNANLDLYAQWNTDMNVAYSGNGQTEGTNIMDIGVSCLDDDYESIVNEVVSHLKKTATYEETGREVDCKFCGWSVRKNAVYSRDREIIWKEGKRLRTKIIKYGYGELFSTDKTEWGDTANKTIINGTGRIYKNNPKYLNQNQEGEVYDKPQQGAGYPEIYCNLYAVWDWYPDLTVEDRYFSLSDAQAGRITEEVLLETVEGKDHEDGLLENGTQVILTDYNAEDFTGFTHAGSVTVTYQATDLVGNQTKEQATVYIVDDTADVELPEESLKDTRFIDRTYLNASYENGGLRGDSVWNSNPQYHSLLVRTLENQRENVSYIQGMMELQTDKVVPGSGNFKENPQQIWQFSMTDIQKVKDYVTQFGCGNVENQNALSLFLQEFAQNKVG